MRLKALFKKIKKRYGMFQKHPLTAKAPFYHLLRYLWINIQFLWKKELIYPWLGSLKLAIQKGDAGIIANAYYYLYEYQESTFLLHTLTTEDEFIDVGANLGHYSLLVAGIRGTTCHAFEPVPLTFRRLMEQISLNQLQDCIHTYHKGVASEAGHLYFSTQHTVMNRVVNASYPNAIEVPVISLDGFMSKESHRAAILKVDVEGYEMQVLLGAEKLLSSPRVKALIIELNYSATQYQVKNSDIVQWLIKRGFSPFEYHPEKRNLVPLEGQNTKQFNTLFVKDLEFVQNRIRKAVAVSYKHKWI
ncbi:MAG: hypothetical protein CMC74_12745 [Flavobacteriaceae bacterium]|nr:hypothetical protein [Flavobacteriaceae bacterium]|tara:strand:- start:33682 stop:34590 length:909 start_codon:yes stop_codon:yes gene_type:complete